MSASAAYQKADDAWSQEIKRVLKGKRGIAEYAKQHRGEPGSNLRLLYENREAARQQWERETFGAKDKTFA